MGQTFRLIRLSCAFVIALTLPGLAPYQAAARSFAARPVAGISAVSIVTTAGASVHSAIPVLGSAVSPLSGPTLLSAPSNLLNGAPSAVVLTAHRAASVAPVKTSAVETLKIGAAQVAKSATSDRSGAAARIELDSLFTGKTPKPSVDLLVPASKTSDHPLLSRADAGPRWVFTTPPDPEKAKRVRGMYAGTAAMKMGMETVTLSIPLLALQTMGGATLVAGLMIVYGLAQAAFSGAAGSLIDRLPAQKVLAGAVVSQAVLVASIIAMGATGILTSWTLFPLYMLVGGAVGIAETSRHSIPPLILGQDEEALSRYNARLHIFYEVAGVAGALATAGLITFVGPLWALALQPPAYLLGGFLFWRVKLAEKMTLKTFFLGPALASIRERIAEYVTNLKAGAGLVLKNDRLRWVAVAFVLPQIVHRVLEGMLAPIFAKRVLLDPGASGYLMTASNMGELLGAVLLLRYAAKIKAPTWVKWGALAMILSWGMAFTSALPFVLPVFLLMSMTWSASDLALRSEVQSSLGEKDQPRATSFLYSSFVLGAAAVSLGLGALFDLLPLSLALAGVFALFTALGAGVLYASRRLSVPKR